MQDSNNVIALLIDAENISQKYIKCIVDEVSLYGTPAYKRIYGDWTRPDMNTWKKMLLEYNITPIQQFSYTQGKNATDSAMIIDAMDILYANHVDGFCLVSSDSDFTKLAARLRESRMQVIGMGERKTPTAFKAACDTFKYLEMLFTSAEDNSQNEKAIKQVKSKSTKPTKSESNLPVTKSVPHSEEDLKTVILSMHEIASTIKNIIEFDSDEDGYMQLSQIGIMLCRKYPDFDTRNYGFNKMHKLIDATGEFDTKYQNLASGGKNLMVKIKNS